MSLGPAGGNAPRTSASEDLAPLLELLHSRQEKRGYLDEDDITTVAGIAGLLPAELYSATSAYPRFRLEPVPCAQAACMGPACRMRGAEALRDGLAGATDTHCPGLCDQPVAVLTADGPRIASPADPTQLLVPSRLRAMVGVSESAFFGDDDPCHTVRAALRRPPDDLIAVVTDSGLQGRGGAHPAPGVRGLYGGSGGLAVGAGAGLALPRRA